MPQWFTPSIPGFPPMDSRLARVPLPPPFRGRIQCWGTPAPAHPCRPEQQPVPGTAVPFLFVMCAEHPRRRLSSVRLPLLVNRALVIALQLDPPINKTDVVKSGSSHCQQLRWIALSCFCGARLMVRPIVSINPDHPCIRPARATHPI